MRAADTFVAVSQLGGRLEPFGDQLRALLPRDCPDEVRAGLRRHKPQLLVLLRHRFLVVCSAVLNETVYFAANEQTKATLAAAGAEPGCIYTREELRELVELNERKPISVADLLRIHETKRIFQGRIAATQRSPQ